MSDYEYFGNHNKLKEKLEAQAELFANALAAINLLEECYRIIGPYGSRDDLQDLDKVRTKLRDYFQFDDSE